LVDLLDTAISWTYTLSLHDALPIWLWSIVVALLINTCISVIALLKGKIWTGVIGVFIGVIALVGAVRLARPDSPWARRRYAPGSRKERWARKREQRYRRPVQRLGDRLSDLVAGRPTGE